MSERLYTFSLWRVWAGVAARDCPFSELSIDPDGLSWYAVETRQSGFLGLKKETVEARRHVPLAELGGVQCGWEFGPGSSQSDPDYFLRFTPPGGPTVKLYMVTPEVSLGQLREAVETLRHYGVPVEDVHGVLER